MASRRCNSEHFISGENTGEVFLYICNKSNENFNSLCMRVLIACEESQTVCKAFREKGHEAYSCDLLECSGGHPEWHFKQDIFEVMDMDWDLMIAHPPCTHLATSGARWFEEKKKDGRQQEGIDFFMAFTKTKIKKVCIENPMGIMSTIYRKPDLILHPYHFGDPFQKTTCLWLHGLPKLVATHFDAPLFGETVDKGYDIQLGSQPSEKLSQNPRFLFSCNLPISPIVLPVLFFAKKFN